MPPNPTVTDLQPTSVELCLGEDTVEFKATTSPPTERVKWTVAVNGGAPQEVPGGGDDGNTLVVGGQPGETKVVTAALTNSLSATASWKIVGIKIDVLPEPDNGRYVITDEPRMPVITATATGLGGSASVSKWEGSVTFRGSHCPAAPQDLTTIYRFSQQGGNKLTIDFGSVVRGGYIEFSATGIDNGCPTSAGFDAGFAGTNPQQTDIQSFLKDKCLDMYKTLQRIACNESGQRQFDAPANGGIAYCPLFGPGGKVGIMQIAKPTDDQIWNWKENVTAGIEKLKESVAAAEGYPNEVMGSGGFQDLVGRFNDRRQQQGLKPLNDVVVPLFTLGDFNAEDDSNLGQRELDAIRGYDYSKDDATDKDQFGLPLHEYRVVVDLIDGEEVLRVTNITTKDDGTLRGKAVWERVPVADRHTGRPNYVEEVLAFAVDCAVRTVPCNLTDISPATMTRFVHSEDSAKFTAKGTGLDQVQWKAPGASPDTGQGATFTTTWLDTGEKTVTATCGSTTKKATVIVLDVCIEINRTSSTSDDIVQLKSRHPPHRFVVPCQIKLIGPATGRRKVVLTNPDGRLRFPTDTITTKTLEVTKAWKVFYISGEGASTDIGDTTIEARLGTDTGPVLTKKNVTVFTFGEAKILLTPGEAFEMTHDLGVDKYEVPKPDVAVHFQAEATLIPTGLDCTADQIKNLRVAIMQESSNYTSIATYGSPKFKRNNRVRGKVTILAPTTLTVTYAFKPGVGQPIADSDLADARPLYTKAARALKPPGGCQGAAPATSDDSPGDPLRPRVRPAIDVRGRRVGTLTYTAIRDIRKQDFRTFCVVYNIVTKEYSALRQATWSLNVDSDKADQRAHVNFDEPCKPPDPVEGPPLVNNSFVQIDLVEDTITTRIDDP